MRQQHWVVTLALAAAVASCATPPAGLNPTGTPAAGPAATMPVGLGTPAPASVKPAPAPELPAAPPIAKDARARLTGTVLFNDTPVADASLTAVDLATGQAIALTPWSDTPKGLKLLSTQRTDAKGAFDFELPKLADNQLVKLVATKGGQTFTALFNSRGQAIGADTPTTATYQLQQGMAISITIRLRLTAGSTAATQAFEGALKLTFQLPEGTSAERQSAVLEAARKAAQEVEAALAKKPEVAARLVAAVNSEGAVGQVENFRTAVTNLGIFDSLFRAVQAELLAVAAQKLEVRKDLAPIDGSEFPLDQVVISPSGLLGFSGQRNPINLGGALTSNFVPTPARGGGGSGGSGAPPAPPRQLFETGEIYRSSVGFYPSLAYLPTALGAARLALAYAPFDSSPALESLDVSAASATVTASYTLSALSSDGFWSVAQARGGSGKLYLDPFDDTIGLKFFDPNSGASGSIEATGSIVALAADSTRVYYVHSGNPAQPVRWRNHSDSTSGVVRASSADWQIAFALRMAVYEPVGGGSSTIFVGDQAGAIFSAQDGGASKTLLTGVGSVTGLAFATPTLYYTANFSEQVHTLNVNSNATSVLVTRTGDGGLITFDALFYGGAYLNIMGLVLDEVDPYLYVLDTQGSGPEKRIVRVRLP